MVSWLCLCLWFVCVLVKEIHAGVDPWLMQSNGRRMPSSFFRLVTGEGLMPRAVQIRSNMDQQGLRHGFSHALPLKVISVLKASQLDFSLLDEALDLPLFSSSEPLVSMSVQDNQLVMLCPTFDNFVAANHYGCKVVDFCTQCSDKVCFLVSGATFFEDQAPFQQCAKRVVEECRRNIRTGVVHVLVDVSGMNSQEQPRQIELLTAGIRKTFSDLDKESTHVHSGTEVSIEFVDFRNGQEIKNAFSTLSQSISNPPLHENVDRFVATAVSSWKLLQASQPLLYFSVEERASLFQVETSYNAGLSQVEESVAVWQTRVGTSGKLIGKFAERVRALHSTVKHRFENETSNVVTIRERSRRWLELEEYLKTSTSVLFNHQFAIIQMKAMSKLKDSLLALSETSQEKIQQAIRNTLFQFMTMVADIEVEELGLKLSPSLIGEISSKFEAMAKEFPETPAAKLNELKKLDVLAKSQKKKAGSRSFGVALNIVGLLKPPGSGNIQGYLNYATSLAGLPLDLLLGFQNDGESPEIMGEDRELPWLRLQPKLHFDIDL